MATFKLIAKDNITDNDGYWSKIAIVSYDGELKTDCNSLSEEQMNEIYDFLKSQNFFISPERREGPGGRFSNEPYFKVFSKIIVINQSGGLDI